MALGRRKTARQGASWIAAGDLPRSEGHVFYRKLNQLLAEAKGLLKGKTVPVDATTLEANAAMRSIVRRDTGEDWRHYTARLMQEAGEIADDSCFALFAMLRLLKSAFASRCLHGGHYEYYSATPRDTPSLTEQANGEIETEDRHQALVPERPGRPEQDSIRPDQQWPFAGRGR